MSKESKVTSLTARRLRRPQSKQEHAADQSTQYAEVLTKQLFGEDFNRFTPRGREILVNEIVEHARYIGWRASHISTCQNSHFSGPVTGVHVVKAIQTQQELTSRKNRYFFMRIIMYDIVGILSAGTVGALTMMPDAFPFLIVAASTLTISAFFFRERDLFRTNR